MLQQGYTTAVEVIVHPAAEEELSTLPERERYTFQGAIEKLEIYGDRLPFPHSSQVKGVAHLRELHPRSGRSPWRAFYRRIGAVLVIGAIGPEAGVDPVGFRRSARAAEERLIAWESESEQR